VRDIGNGEIAVSKARWQRLVTRCARCAELLRERRRGP